MVQSEIIDTTGRIRLDEHDTMVLPLDEQDPGRAGCGWMNMTPWRAG